MPHLPEKVSKERGTCHGGQDQVTFATRARCDEGFEAELLHRDADGLHMAVMSRANDLEQLGDCHQFLAFKDWNTAFPNASCIVTLIDRLTHHADVTLIEGDSYRKRESEQEAAARRKRKS